MKIVNLMENTPGVDGCLYEHGLSFYIETGHHKLLMDTGASEAILVNARKLGIDLKAIDTVVLSHGHYDHSGGILAFVRENPHARIYMRRSAAMDYYHVDPDSCRYIGIDKRILELPGLVPVDGDLRIDEELYLFTNIRRPGAVVDGDAMGQEQQGKKAQGQDVQGEKAQGQNVQGEKAQGQDMQEGKAQGQNVQGGKNQGQNVQGGKAQGQDGQGQDPQGGRLRAADLPERLRARAGKGLMRRVGEEFVEDIFDHEQCLVVTGEDGQILLSGCAHNGILNILDRYHEIFHGYPDRVISGFHLARKAAYSQEDLLGIQEIARRLLKTGALYDTGHCTGMEAFAVMKEIMGDRLEYIHSGEQVL